MALFLNILLSVLSVGVLAGRVYEILNITDISTGFLTSTGIVFNPYILVIFIVIAICCGILIFQSEKKVEPFFSKSDGVFAIIAGVALLGAAILNLNTGKIACFAIIGGITFILLGALGLKNKFTDKLIMLLMLIFVVGINLDVIVFNVSTIHNIEFLKNALSYLSITIFALMVFKNMYAPSRISKMYLYISGYLSFVFCTIMYIADVMGDFAQARYELPQLIWDLSFIFIGFYAFATALSVSSSVKYTQVQEDYEYEDNDEDTKDEDDEYFLNLNREILKSQNLLNDNAQDETYNEKENNMPDDNSKSDEIEEVDEKSNDIKNFFNMQYFEEDLETENIKTESKNKIKYSTKNNNKKIIYKKPK